MAKTGGMIRWDRALATEGGTHAGAGGFESETLKGVSTFSFELRSFAQGARDALERLIDHVPLGSFFQIWDREGTPSLTDDRKFDINGNGVSDWEEYDISMKVNGNENTQFESFVMEDLDMIELSFTSK